MPEAREHPHIHKLKKQFSEGRIPRREFLRFSTLLGLSATAAYGFVGKVAGAGFARPARAALPRGGTLRFGLRVQDLSEPHAYAWSESEITRQVAEHLTRTGPDNVTRPYLLERWEASDDLRTWTLHLRRDITWRSGRQLNADDVIANLLHVLSPDSGSSVIGLMKSYMLDDPGTGLWDANAIEKIDDFALRLNAKNPQLAVPEHLFHFPLHILDPEEGWKFGIGSNGTGAYELVDYQVGEKAVIEKKRAYWREGAYLDRIIYIDLGDDTAATLGALASKQVDGVYNLAIEQIDIVKSLEHLKIHSANTAQTAVARVKVDQKPFDDPRVRKAMRLAIDTRKVLELSHRSLGNPGEHTHVAPMHPEYAELPFMARDIPAAQALLAEAGYPDGFETTIDCNANQSWEVAAAQVMAEQWKDAGIRVAINVMPGTTYWDIWDKTPFGLTRWNHRPLGIMTLSLAYRSGVPWNESNFSNATFDQLLTEAEGTLDLEVRREIMAKLQGIMQEEGPIVQPLWRAVFTAFDKRVQGVQMHPTSYYFFEDMAIEP